MYKFTYLIFLCSILSFSQVGINTIDPDPSSIMDIHSTNKGLLIPRINLNNRFDQNTIQSPAEGLLVFHLGNEVMVRGFYYWAALEWHYLNTDMKDAWLLEGNTVLDPESALGTNNVMNLKLKTNNKVVADFNPSGGFVIGMNSSADPSNAIAIGRSARAVEPQNIAIGLGSAAIGDVSIASGAYAQAQGSFSTAVGTGSISQGFSASAVGHTAMSYGEESLAMGVGARAMATNAAAVGSYTEAMGTKSLALGPNSKAWAENSVALGAGAKADVANTIILGEVFESDVVERIPVKVGIGTRNPKARLDVHGDFKMGANGNSLKGISAFSAEIDENTVVPANGTQIKVFGIPEDIRPLTTRAVIQHTVREVNDDLSVQWTRFNGNGSIRVKFKNDRDTPVDIHGLIINFAITEF